MWKLSVYIILMFFFLEGIGFSQAKDNNNRIDSSKTGGLDAASLWEARCTKCHNLRTYEAFSEERWKLVMLHMRIRADLTSEEARLILNLLKEGAKTSGP